MYSRTAFCSLSIPSCVAEEKFDPQNQLSGAVVGLRVYIAPKREVMRYRLTENQREESLCSRVSFYFSCFISSDFQDVLRLEDFHHRY